MNNSDSKKSCDSCGCNSGVRCDVTNCFYHDGEKRCAADTIHVGPQFAVSCQDTTCATFKSK